MNGAIAERDPLDGREFRCIDCGYRMCAELIQSARYDFEFECPRCGNSIPWRFELVPEREKESDND